MEFEPIEEHVPCSYCGQVIILRYNGRSGGGEPVSAYDPWLEEQQRTNDAQFIVPRLEDWEKCVDCEHRKLSHVASAWNCTETKGMDKEICGCLEVNYSQKRKVLYEMAPATV